MTVKKALVDHIIIYTSRKQRCWDVAQLPGTSRQKVPVACSLSATEWFTGECHPEFRVVLSGTWEWVGRGNAQQTA